MVLLLHSHAALASKRGTAVQNTVVVDDCEQKIQIRLRIGRQEFARTDGSPRTKLDPVLRVCAREEFVPSANGIIPLLYLVGIQIVHNASVVVVPSHLDEFPSYWIVAEYRITASWIRLVESRRFTSGMSRDRRVSKDRICVRVEFLEDRSDIKSVN